MTSFIKGNLVSLRWEVIEADLGTSTKNYSIKNKLYFESIHILSSKDIRRGYFYTDCNTLIKLVDCEYYKSSCRYRSVFSGKRTQPIPFIKFIGMTMQYGSSSICYIIFKGNKTKMVGTLSKDNTMFYFHTNSGYYKTKVYVTQEGLVNGVGVGENSLSCKQRRGISMAGKGIEEVNCNE